MLKVKIWAPEKQIWWDNFSKVLYLNSMQNMRRVKQLNFKLTTPMTSNLCKIRALDLVKSLVFLKKKASTKIMKVITKMSHPFWQQVMSQKITCTKTLWIHLSNIFKTVVVGIVCRRSSLSTKLVIIIKIDRNLYSQIIRRKVHISLWVYQRWWTCPKINVKVKLQIMPYTSILILIQMSRRKSSLWLVTQASVNQPPSSIIMTILRPILRFKYKCNKVKILKIADSKMIIMSWVSSITTHLNIRLIMKMYIAIKSLQLKTILYSSSKTSVDQDLITLTPSRTMMIFAFLKSNIKIMIHQREIWIPSRWKLQIEIHFCLAMTAKKLTRRMTTSKKRLLLNCQQMDLQLRLQMHSTKWWPKFHNKMRTLMDSKICTNSILWLLCKLFSLYSIIFVS